MKQIRTYNEKRNDFFSQINNNNNNNRTIDNFINIHYQVK